jgi:hypothetical protein
VTLPPLDIVLIDGAHAFPFPFLDWYFTASALKAGGLLVIDDVQIATGTILADFSTWTRGGQAWHGPDALRHFAAEPRALRRRRTGKASLTWRTTIQHRACCSCANSPRGAVERAAGRYLPWRVQDWLRQRYRWPRPSWVD